MARADRDEQPPAEQPRGDASSLPTIGEVVHFYELRHGQVYGPLAAMVTAPGGRNTNALNLAVIGEGAIRFVPLVPHDDQGREAGMWWRRAEPVDPEYVRQSGL